MGNDTQGVRTPDKSGSNGIFLSFYLLTEVGAATNFATATSASLAGGCHYIYQLFLFKTTKSLCYMVGETRRDWEDLHRAPLIPFFWEGPGDPMYDDNGHFYSAIVQICFSAIVIVHWWFWDTLRHLGIFASRTPKVLSPHL